MDTTETEEKIESLTKKLLESFEQITSFHDFSESIHHNSETEEICALLIEECKKAINFLHTEVYLLSENNNKIFTHFFTLEKESKTTLKEEINIEKTPFSEMLKGNTSHIIIEDCKDFLDKADSLPVICVPIKFLNKVEGILCAAEKTDHSNFTTEDLLFMQTLATQGALAIRNNRLLEDYRELFINTVKTLTKAIDSKDPYTCDHSKRVTEYAITIAKTMKMGKEELREIELSGLLHDVGKIGIPETVLNKPYKLSPKEFEIMKQHTYHGVKILSGIKKFSNIIPAIKHHHEQFDGSGYPCGLKGKKIPLFARILTIADSYDAITSDRAYRKKLSHEQAVTEIIKGAGTQYDPELIKIFKKTELVFKQQKRKNITPYLR